MNFQTNNEEEKSIGKGKSIAIRLKPSKEAQPAKKTVHSRTIELSPDKLSIEKLRAIWNTKEVTYTDEELYKIRDWLYSMASVTIDHYYDCKAAEQTETAEQKVAAERTTSTPILPSTRYLNPAHSHHHTHEAEESHSLHPGIYRRAS